jgi:sugar lactone lactonase YvrE
VAEPNGTIWVANDHGGVTRIDKGEAPLSIGRLPAIPNGLAMEASGDFLIANVGDGALYRLHRDGRYELIMNEVNGIAIEEAANFVLLDSRERIWVTISTRVRPRADALRSPVADGYIILLDGQTPRIVADGLMFTNEARLDADERYLYVAETSAARISRFEVLDDGNLGPRQTYGPEPLVPGGWVDGITFDVEGNLWFTEVRRSGLHILLPNGRVHTVFEDPRGTSINYPTSITFGGPDLRTAYVGSLHMDRVAMFRSPTAGLPLFHWNRAGSR